jgi:hypothetical protein
MPWIRRPAFATAPTWRPFHSPTTAANLTSVDDRSALGRTRIGERIRLLLEVKLSQERERFEPRHSS